MALKGSLALGFVEVEEATISLWNKAFIL